LDGSCESTKNVSFIYDETGLLTVVQNGWQDSQALALGPTGNGSYNGLGIFSGTAQPVNLKGEVDGTLLIFYTSVSYLPTSWSVYYAPHTESQSLAYSVDGGKTWEQYAGNPVINATTGTAPMDWNITGFRDPFMEPLPEIDALLGVSEPHYYAVFGSGIKGVGPRMPLWTAPASDLTKWSFLGALWEPADNTTLGPVLSTGSYGFNFEVSGFYVLHDEKGNPHYFVNMGTEGGNVSFHESSHWALWNEGTVSRRDNGSVQFTPIAGGAADYGLSYAITSFNDTKNNRRVQWGWAPEDIVGDGGIFSANAQGFQGSLTLPRELFIHEVDNVVDVDSAIAESKSAVLSKNEDGTYTAQSLGIRPLPDVIKGMTSNATYKNYGSKTYDSSAHLEQQGSAHMELKATIGSATGAFGLRIAASPDGTEHTTITYQPSNNTILVDRTHSSTIVGFNNATVTGFFIPYTISTGSDNSTKQECITFDIFVDGSLVEIYINERFALATRIYPSQECSTGFGVVVEEGGSVEFKSIEAWLGTKNVWPERPLNSSSPLLWDSAEETDGYTWWTGN
jgi:sucrose-6-phosphate hydrolase SacC (GH32 family)